MNLSAKQKQTHRRREQTCSCQGARGVGEWWTGSLGLAGANSYTGWINNKVLLCSTGNCIQYPIINYNGENMKKSIYMYVLLNHFAVSRN